MTSLAFMFVEVPAPPWMTPTTNWSWNSPSMMRWQASSIQPAFSRVEHADLAVRARRGLLHRGERADRGRGTPRWDASRSGSSRAHAWCARPSRRRPAPRRCRASRSRSGSRAEGRRGASRAPPPRGSGGRAGVRVGSSTLSRLHCLMRAGSPRWWFARDRRARSRLRAYRRRATRERAAGRPHAPPPVVAG